MASFDILLALHFRYGRQLSKKVQPHALPLL